MDESDTVQKLRKLIYSTGDISSAVEKMREQNIPEQEIESALKEIINSGQATNLVEDKKEVLNMKVFFLKFLLVCLASGFTVLAAFYFVF